MTKKYTRMLEELSETIAMDIVNTWKLKADTCRQKDNCSKPLCFIEALSSDQLMFLATAAVATVVSYEAELDSYVRDYLISKEFY